MLLLLLLLFSFILFCVVVVVVVVVVVGGMNRDNRLPFSVVLDTAKSSLFGGRDPSEILWQETGKNGVICRSATSDSERLARLMSKGSEYIRNEISIMVNPFSVLICTVVKEKPIAATIPKRTL